MKISLRECLLITLLCAVPLGVARRFDMGAGTLLTFLPCAYCVWRFFALSKVVTSPPLRIILAGIAGGLGTIAVMAIEVEFILVAEGKAKYAFWEIQLGFFWTLGFLGGLIVGCIGESFVLYSLRQNEPREVDQHDAGS